MADKMQAKIYASLYNNVFNPDKDQYVARVQSNGTSTNEDIAREIVNQRSEFRYETILHILNLGSDVKRNHLVNGKSVNDGVLQVIPVISGNFTGAAAQFDPQLHSLNLSAVVTPVLRKRMTETEVIVRGLALIGPVINKIEDVYTQKENEILTPGHILKIHGQKIRIAGGNPENGIYFIDSLNTQNRIRTALEDIVLNNPKQIMLVVPPLNSGSYFVEVITQFSNHTTITNKPREFRYEQPLIVM